jgi:hypothetical protein
MLGNPGRRRNSLIWLETFLILQVANIFLADSGKPGVKSGSLNIYTVESSSASLLCAKDVYTYYYNFIRRIAFLVCEDFDQGLLLLFCLLYLLDA